MKNEYKIEDTFEKSGCEVSNCRAIDLILGCPFLPRSITNDHSSSQIKKFSSFPQKFQKKWKKRHSDQRGVRNSRIWGKEWENDMRKISPFSTIFSNFFWAHYLLLYYNCSFRYLVVFQSCEKFGKIFVANQNHCDGLMKKVDQSSNNCAVYFNMGKWFAVTSIC